MNLVTELFGMFLAVFFALTYVEIYNKKHTIVRNNNLYTKIENNIIAMLSNLWSYFYGDLSCKDMPAIYLLPGMEQPVELTINTIQNLKEAFILIELNSKNDESYFGYKDRKFTDLITDWYKKIYPSYIHNYRVFLKPEVQPIANNIEVIEQLGQLEKVLQDLGVSINESKEDEITKNFILFLDKSKTLLESIRDLKEDMDV